MNKKIFLFIFLLVLSVNLVSAITFNKDTTFTSENINVIFKDGISLNTFDVNSRGLILDGQSFIFYSEDILNIIINEYNGISDNNFEIYSNVEQDVKFSVVSNGVGYSFYDGSTFMNDKIKVDLKGVNGSFVVYENNSVKKIVYDALENTPWLKESFFDFEIDQEIKNGEIIGRVISVPNYIFLLIIIFILILLFMMVFK